MSIAGRIQGERALIIHNTATSCETPSQVINNKNYDTHHNMDPFLVNGSSFARLLEKQAKIYGVGGRKTLFSHFRMFSI